MAKIEIDLPLGRSAKRTAGWSCALENYYYLKGVSDDHDRSSMPCVSSGVYPGSFNPPTIAHLAIANAGRKHYGLDRVELAISRVALDKETVTMPTFEDRVDVVRRSCDDLEWLDVVVTNDQLLADIADGYDVLIMGEDKWAQLHELRFYDSPEHMNASLQRLPSLAIAPRPDTDALDAVAIPVGTRLDVEDWILDVSSSAARSGRPEWMTPAATASGHWSR